MNQNEIQQIGYDLFIASKTHEQINPPSVAHPDITYEEGYAIQQAMIRNLLADGFTLSGKKVGLTSNAMRRVANIYEPDYGYIFQELCYPNGIELPVSQFIAPRIECELAFKLKDDIEGEHVTKDQVLSATEYIVCCFEVCDFRIFREKFQRIVQDSISDNAAFGAYILGDTPIKPYDFDLRMVPYIFEVNHKLVETSCGAAVYPEAWEAKKNGVLFDSARGSRNWSSEVAKAAFAQGFFPDVITDDLTALSNDPQTSRLTVHMSECMALGMSFDDVLYKATNVPASYMKGVQVGLNRGMPANITILELEKGPHDFTDAFGEHYEGDTFIKPRTTIIGGKIMFNTIETD